MRQRFLVTGGTGFIGSAIVKYLVKNNYLVTVIDNNERGKISRLKEVYKKIKYINADIRDIKKVNAACKNIDSVIHLAYINGTEFFYSKPELILDIATKGISNILDASIINKVKNFYLASSSEVYQSPEVIPTPENVPLVVPDLKNPRFSYGGGKIISELMAYHFGKKYFKKVIIFRPHNIYGPDMGNEHVLPQLIAKIKENIKIHKRFIKIQGSGNETRAFTHIEDFIKSFDCILKKGKHLEVYNIGTAEEIKIIDVVNIILKELNLSFKIKKSKILKGSTLKRCPDIKKISKLGFKQKINFRNGIKDLIKFHFK
jgi:nucleoside-diphosphate-sugar epimerase